MTTLFHTLMARTGQRLLQQSHYPDDLEWRWSLGYCQGDGYACVGHLDNTALQQLLPALAERQSLSPETQQTLATLLSQSPIAVSLTLQDGLRYTHAGCIQIEILDFPDAEEVLYQTFYQILRQDLVSLCSEAEHQGYRLLNATLPPTTATCCLSDGHGILHYGPSPKPVMMSWMIQKTHRCGMTRWTCCCTTVPVCSLSGWRWCA
ncbi:TPA: hypothetical protein U5E38_003880 [Yersinia enterocolitica]|nr:hypothetical protein [Yersinia enterocolitica]HEN3619795.1 hypothetical protein [Yersinia enterocolitica]HEO0719250.1 hypothetical protein [Yersinia enterocolitica]